MTLPESPDAPEQAALRAIVHGRVQGVGYRYFVIERARPLGLAGRVRNLPDGTVEVIASGPRETLEKFVGELRTGPSFSRVTDVEVQWDAVAAPTEGFTISY